MASTPEDRTQHTPFLFFRCLLCAGLLSNDDEGLSRASGTQQSRGNWCEVVEKAGEDGLHGMKVYGKQCSR